MVPQRVTDRLLASRIPSGDCLISTYSVGSHGYSQIGWTENGRNRMVLGHRVAWEAVHGPITDGLTVDHVCRNRRCCNVAHLRLLSNRDNARDNAQANRLAARTHCPQGHPYEGSNLFVGANGRRKCRACRNAAAAESHRKARQRLRTQESVS
jgi:hypothetical protein